MRQTQLLTAIVLLLAGTTVHAQAERRVARLESFIAATRMFAFYSDPAVNLHDFLFARMRLQDRIDAQPGCLAELAPGEREAFERARTYYEDAVATRQWFDDLVIAIRYELAGFTGTKSVPESAKAIEQVNAALPAYRRCWWPHHDSRNREWIGQLVPRLIAHEDALRERLGRLYEGEWRAPLAVDVVGAASPVGANSLGDPDHILISSGDPGYSGWSALEMVFHEAGHTLFGPGQGAVWKALQHAATKSGREVPRQLWHGILFYMTGKVVQTLLAERGTPDYKMYMERGVFKQFHQPLETHWKPYVEGRITLQDAASQVLAAVK